MGFSNSLEVTNLLLATNELQVANSLETTNELLPSGVLPTLPTPTFSPVAGSYASSQTVTITSVGATAIYYTTDGSTPTTGSTLYTGPITVSTSETIKALATAIGYNNSAIGSAAYVIGYQFFKTITIQASQVASNLVNFPVLFAGTYAYLATVPNGGGVQSSSGYDIILSTTNNPNGSGIIPFERRNYNPVTGAVIFHVLASALSSSVNTVLYVLYGNSFIVTDQQNPTAVWDTNFTQVSHLDQASGSQILDSTSNGHNSTLNFASTQVAGKWGEATQFLLANSANAQFPASWATTPAGGSTFSTWINVPNNSNYAIGLETRNSSGTGGLLYTVITTGFASMVETGNGSATSTVVAADGTWHYIASTYNGTTTIEIYVDGNAPVSGSSSNPSAYGASWQLGKSFTATPFYSSSNQELRISNTVRTASWLLTEFNNQSSPSTFYTIT